jgi:predicted  nucleic acid-binding Zn-ribbon protein
MSVRFVGRMLGVSSVIALLCAQPVFAEGEAPFVAKEWSFQKKALALPWTEACVASTQKVVGTDTWTLTLVYDPAVSIAPALVVSTPLAGAPAFVTAQTDGSETKFQLYRLESLDAAVGGQAYWFAPQDLSGIYKALRRDNSFKVSYVPVGGTPQKFNFSLNGSSSTLNELTKQCAPGTDGTELIEAKFFDPLLKLKTDPLAVADQHGVAAVWAELQTDWTRYHRISAEQANLKFTQDAIKPLVDLETAYLKQSGQLTQDISSRGDKKKKLEDQNARSQQSIAGAKAQLEQLEPGLAAAQAEFDRTNAVFTPIFEKGKPFFDAVESADGRLDSADRELSARRQDQVNAEAQLSALQSELSSIASQLDSLDSDLADTQSRRIQAQSDLNNFNTDQELQRLLNSDSFYQQRQRDLQAANADVVNLQDSIRRGDFEVRRAEQELRRCQNQRPDRPGPGGRPDGGFGPGGRPDGGPGGHFPGGPGGGPGGPGAHFPGGPGGGPGGPGGGFPPPPPPDCTAYESAYQSAQSQLSNLQSQLQAANSRIPQIQADLDGRRAQLQNFVFDSRSRLAQAVTDLDLQINSIQASDRSLRRRQDAIRAQEIPDANRQIASAQQAVSASRARYDAASRDLQARQAELAAYKAKTGYDAKNDANNQAWSELSSIRDQMTALDASIRKSEASIATSDAAIQKLQTEIEKLTAAAAQNNSALADVEARLKPLAAEKERLTAVIAQLQAELKAGSIQYKLMLAELQKSTGATRLLPLRDARFFDWQ